MNINLRPATKEDAAWLEPFYEGIMRPYFDLSQSWDATYFRKHFEPGRSQIIQQNGEDIGYYNVTRHKDHIFLSDIQLVEAYQGKGIGGGLLHQLLADAQDLNLPVRLHVLKGNPAALLYQRLGFDIHDEHETFWDLKWLPR